MQQDQINKLKADIARVTRMMANPGLSAADGEMLDKQRQKYHMALKILTKN